MNSMKNQTSQKKEPIKQKLDPLKNLKHKGYCRAFASVGDEPMTYSQFLVYARTYLCNHAHVLFKDPIWDSYTEEELLIEYFSVLYKNDPIKKEEFEKTISNKPGNYDDFLNFADEQIKKNKQDMEEEQNNLPDRLEFSPETLGN